MLRKLVGVGKIEREWNVNKVLLRSKLNDFVKHKIKVNVELSQINNDLNVNLLINRLKPMVDINIKHVKDSSEESSYINHNTNYYKNKDFSIHTRCDSCFKTLSTINSNTQTTTEQHEKLDLISIATDAVVIKGKQILLITRKHDPYKGRLAFPGGFVDYNEDPAKGCLRELLEEASIKAYKTTLLGMRSDPNRDPRQHVVSFIYKVEVEDDQVPEANDDADTARYYELSSLVNKKELFAFDHYDILSSYVKFN